MSEERLAYNIRQAAEVLGISKSLASKMVKDGRIKSVKLGRRVVIPHWAILEALETPAAATPETVTIESLLAM